MFANPRRPLVAVLAAFVVLLATQGFTAWLAARGGPEDAAGQARAVNRPAMAVATARPGLSLRDFAPLLWRR